MMMMMMMIITIIIVVIIIIIIVMMIMDNIKLSRAFLITFCVRQIRLGCVSDFLTTNFIRSVH